jgi:curved DNA-binding protein CbpA
MTDYFALLRQPRCPWVDPASLKEAFLSRAKAVHPDKADIPSAAAYSELNAAYQCLRTSRTRILHLIELETGNQPQLIQEIPAAMTEFFMRVTQMMREADAFLRVWPTVTGLVKAQHFAEAQEHVQTLQALQRDINLRTEALERELGELSNRWESRRSEAIIRLRELSQLFSYYARWSSQIQERLTRLAL